MQPRGPDSQNQFIVASSDGTKLGYQTIENEIDPKIFMNIDIDENQENMSVNVKQKPSIENDYGYVPSTFKGRSLSIQSAKAPKRRIIHEISPARN